VIEKIKLLFQEFSRWIFLIITIVLIIEGLYKISFSLVVSPYVTTFPVRLSITLLFFAGLSMVILGLYCVKLCTNYFRYREIPTKKFVIFLIIFSILTSIYVFILSIVLLICIVVSTSLT